METEEDEPFEQYLDESQCPSHGLPLSGSPSQCKASYSTNSSLNSSVNLSTSFLAYHDMEDSMSALQSCFVNLQEIRGDCLQDIKRRMNEFKNSLSLWNEGGFIPLLTNFMSWISEADREINSLSQRITTNTQYLQNVVRWQQKQQKALQQKSKQLLDSQFEVNALQVIQWIFVILYFIALWS